MAGLLGFFLLLNLALDWSQDREIIVDHACTDIAQIPAAAILAARQKLHIAVGHTAPGSRPLTGMEGLQLDMNHQGYPDNLYAWNEGGTGGALDIRADALGEDAGCYPAWFNNTYNYLGTPDSEGRGSKNPDINVIVWPWCGQAAGLSEHEMLTNYLIPMSTLEADYPGIKFVYMTAPLEGSGSTGNRNARNNQIRKYCISKNKILYDVADIESYDPDGLTKNGNLKAHAAWWLWAKLGGWNWSAELPLPDPRSETRAIKKSRNGASGKYNSPAQLKILPEVIWAAATGGGTWMSEVQVTDISGGSQVSVYYSTSAGRRGPFLVWNNSDGALRSMNFTNMLQTIDGLDSDAFTYYGTVGAVEFVSQDAAHMLQVMARTLNGDFSKTFPALSIHDSNTADTSRVMMIPNLTNNRTYRSTCGMYNPTGDALTVELRLYDAANTRIGNTITRTMSGYGFSAFSPFSDAGVAYPAYSFDNVILQIQPISGTGRVLCFGASANNTTNDPAAHIAVQTSLGHDNGPSSQQILPEAIWAAATGGGTWMTEVQIVDVTGGSAVSVFFDYGGGNSHGPTVLWTGSGAGAKVKYDNILQQLGEMDNGFSYYGLLGTLEFKTQNSAHCIQVMARTRNGDYSKNFPCLNLVNAETADTSRMMLIQNYSNNSMYRSTAGLFNPTVAALTVEFILYHASGAQIGSTFSRTFAGYDFYAFNPFTEAGVPYPANSYDNIILKVRPTAGKGRVVCFGASANNISNDPAVHLAVQGQ